MQRPPLVVCQCGRRHRAWNRYRLCPGCSRERRAAEDVRVGVLADEAAAASQTAPAGDVLARLEASYRSWLARQPAGHPFRAAERGRVE